MEKEIIEKFAKLIAAIDAADTDKLIVYKPSKRDVEAIQIMIPEKLINDEEFNRKILELGVIPSRLTASKISNKKNQKTSEHIYTIIIYDLLDLDIQALDEQCQEFSEQSLKELAPKQIALLVLQMFRFWNTLPGGLKTHRRLTPSMVKGYLKQRETFTHHELMQSLVVYGKWAEAKRKAIADGDIDSFWFHRWDLDSLLASNKAMNHIGDGWRELVKAKGIPEDYNQLNEDRPKYLGINQPPEIKGN